MNKVEQRLDYIKRIKKIVGKGFTFSSEYLEEHEPKVSGNIPFHSLKSDYIPIECQVQWMTDKEIDEKKMHLWNCQTTIIPYDVAPVVSKVNYEDLFTSDLRTILSELSDYVVWNFKEYNNARRLFRKREKMLPSMRRMSKYIIHNNINMEKIDITNLQKGTLCKVIKTETVTIDGEEITLHDDIIGDTVKIIQKEDAFSDEDIAIYLVLNTIKGFEHYVSSTILEVI